MDRDPKQMTDSLCPAPQSPIRLLWWGKRDWRGQTASVSTSAEQVLVMVVCSQETHSLKHTLTLERIGGFAAPVQSAVIETGGVDCCCYPDTRLMSKHWKTEASELFGKELGCQTRSNSLNAASYCQNLQRLVTKSSTSFCGGIVSWRCSDCCCCRGKQRGN